MPVLTVYRCPVCRQERKVYVNLTYPPTCTGDAKKHTQRQMKEIK